MALSPKQVVERWFTALFRERDPSVIAELRSERATSTGLAPSPIVGVDAWEAFYRRVTAVLTDTDVRFDSIVAEDDRVAVLFTITGTIRGKAAELSGACFGRVVEGRLVEGRNVVDVAGFARALGFDAPRDLSDALTLAEARGA
jgi:hypothetical protein